MSTSLKHIIISGRVQGVGFRRYVFNQAQELKIQGWVRNLWDGRVEVLAALNFDNEKQFLELLKKGPKFSEVAEVQIQNVSGSIVLEGFQIKEDGRTLYAI